jgi:hypothetical protein
VFSGWLDLADKPINHPDVEYFTDGSTFVWDRTHFATYAVVTLDTVIEPHPLQVRTSAQEAEFIALTQ